MKRTLNPFFTAEQERLRELVVAMFKDERPLSADDLRQLGPFVKVVREEIVEDTTPGSRSIRRVSYYMLNDIGRDLYLKWTTGKLDHLVANPAASA